ncbi:hypothetical protein NC652_017278 [Populus alba x Populus x berolinensis]|nr:hypothetical protein NC652_017278 [Populus alba x Populus x berolinensis]
MGGKRKHCVCFRNAMYGTMRDNVISLKVVLPMEMWSRQLLVLERVLQVVVSYFSVALFFSFSFSWTGERGGDI